MRLSAREIQTVRKVLHDVDPNGRIYLFGSRVDDTKKGGDIDVFFEASMQLDLRARLALEYQLATLCGTKVDLIVKNPGQEDKAIFGIAREGVAL